MSKICDKKCWFLPCSRRIWRYSKTALKELFFWTCSISKESTCFQSRHETRHWNTWHLNSTLLRKYYMFWKVKPVIKVLCSGYKYCLGHRQEMVWLRWSLCWKAPALLLAAPAPQGAEAWVGQLTLEWEVGKCSHPGQLRWCLSLFIGYEWINMPVFLCAVSAQVKWTLGDTNWRWCQNVGHAVVFALPQIWCFLFWWRMLLV